jgi:hypothetical protein
LAVFYENGFIRGEFMSDQTKTGINLDMTRELKGYCPSIAAGLIEGNYNLNELNLSFEEACKKLAEFRKSQGIIIPDEDLEFEDITDDKK